MARSEEGRDRRRGKGGENFQRARALATNPTVGSRWMKEQDEEKEQMPLLLQVSSFVTLHLRESSL